MIIAITGSDGFVGRNLINALVAEGHKIIYIDITSGIDITKHDDSIAIPRFEVMVHLAAKLFVPDSYLNPREFYYTNIVGTLNMLELCRKYNARFIFASSYVYGVPQYLPIDESHPLMAFNPYADTKIHGENLCRSYSNFYNIRTVIVRPSNIIGKGQNESFLIPSIFAQAKTGIIQLQDSKPKRDYIYIDDVILAYLKIIHADKLDFEIINIGSGSSYSVKEISAIVNSYYGNKLEIKFTETERFNEVLNTVYNIKKAKKLLDWSPKVSLQDGLSYIFNSL
jgi:nucleoside-diphosphate-sugar epimerase